MGERGTVLACRRNSASTHRANTRRCAVIDSAAHNTSKLVAEHGPVLIALPPSLPLSMQTLLAQSMVCMAETFNRRPPIPRGCWTISTMFAAPGSRCR